MYFSLDEVNQALDEQGKEKVVEVLLKEENLNTYLVISWLDTPIT